MILPSRGKFLQRSSFALLLKTLMKPLPRQLSMFDGPIDVIGELACSWYNSAISNKFMGVKMNTTDESKLNDSPACVLNKIYLFIY